MKIRLLNWIDLAGAKKSGKAELNEKITAVKNKINRTELKINLLYLLAIISITAWIVSLQAFPFGDTFQFLLGAVVLSVNLMIFKHTKI